MASPAALWVFERRLLICPEEPSRNVARIDCEWRETNRGGSDQDSKDGMLRDNSVRMEFGSGKRQLDEAAVSAIRTAAPFGRLPKPYPGSSLDLRFTSFHFNGMHSWDQRRNQRSFRSQLYSAISLSGNVAYFCWMEATYLERL